MTEGTVKGFLLGPEMPCPDTPGYWWDGSDIQAVIEDCDGDIVADRGDYFEDVTAWRENCYTPEATFQKLLAFHDGPEVIPYADFN